MTVFINPEAPMAKEPGSDTIAGPAYEAAMQGSTGQLCTKAVVEYAAGIDATTADTITVYADRVRRLYEEDVDKAACLYGQLGRLSANKDEKQRQLAIVIQEESADALDEIEGLKIDSLTLFRSANILIATELVALKEGDASVASRAIVDQLDKAAELFMDTRQSNVRDVRDAHYARQRGLRLPGITLAD